MLKNQIIELLRSTGRIGIENVIVFLEGSDFFTAPASTKYHSCHIGGLAEHSWSVMGAFAVKVTQFGLDVPNDSVVIAGLLHDLCKVNTYKRGVKNVKDGKKLNFKGQEVDNWVEKEVWEWEDKFNLGHGEKSVILLQPLMPLTNLELMLIRWHMGNFEAALSAYNEAVKFYPAIVALHCADMESSHIFEKQGE
jgi:hypothetical protein